MKNPNHRIMYDYRAFCTAQVRDTYEGVDYDMTVIFVEADNEDQPEIVGCYYGEPNMHDTIAHIEKYVSSHPMPVVSGITEDDISSAMIEDTSIERADVKMWREAERLKRVLTDCMVSPGDTSIKITVERANKTATASLYDHAALVQGLYDALDYFQSEL